MFIFFILFFKQVYVLGLLFLYKQKKRMFVRKTSLMKFSAMNKNNTEIFG